AIVGASHVAGVRRGVALLETNERLILVEPGIQGPELRHIHGPLQATICSAENASVHRHQVRSKGDLDTRHVGAAAGTQCAQFLFDLGRVTMSAYVIRLERFVRLWKMI